MPRAPGGYDGRDTRWTACERSEGVAATYGTPVAHDNLIESIAMPTDHLAALQALGFQRAGAFTHGQFELEPEWRAREVLYAWIRRSGGVDEVLRVGIACGPNGFGARYASYNRWLAGRFKPNDAAEQFKAGLFRQKLDGAVTVWAVPVASKPEALQAEAKLRELFGAMELDLMTRGWAKQEMVRWRAADRPQQAGARNDTAAQPRPRPSAAVDRRQDGAPRKRGAEVDANGEPVLSPALKAPFGAFERIAREHGLTRAPSGDGFAFKLGRNTVFAVDPKPSLPQLRVKVGEAAYLAAPAELRRSEHRQREWLAVAPADLAVAVDYVAAFASARVRDLSK